MKTEREVRELIKAIEREREAAKADLASRTTAQTVYVPYRTTRASVGWLEDAVALLNWVLA